MNFFPNEISDFIRKWRRFKKKKGKNAIAGRLVICRPSASNFHFRQHPTYLILSTRAARSIQFETFPFAQVPPVGPRRHFYQ